MRHSTLKNIRYLAVIVGLALVGLAAAGYVLIKQRLKVPFSDTYDVNVVLRAADGVAPGFGQAVNVAGVKVGTISKADLVGDVAKVTLTIDRGKLPRVYADARANLRPITPVKDMELDLEPGSPSKKPLPEGATIPDSRTTTPVPLSDLLSTLDSDTRAFMTSMLAGLGEGTDGRAPDLRRVLLALGPTAGQLRQITTTLSRRRHALSRLVHNVDAVTKAAADDGRLAEVVAAGNRTLAAIAQQEAPLKEAVALLPSTLDTAQSALRNTGALADELGPAVDALTPPIRRLPTTLKRDIGPVARHISTALERQVRPLAREAQPLAKALAPAVPSLTATAPEVTRNLQVARYLLNESAYVPKKGELGEGKSGLYWYSWLFHNWNSLAGNADAHGAILRVTPTVQCDQTIGATDLQAFVYRLIFNKSNICEEG